jgi:diguanylate cyclase (GGDEF)-like protein
MATRVTVDDDAKVSPAKVARQAPTGGLLRSWLGRMRRLELWSVHSQARAYILTVEVLVAVLVVLALVRTHVDAAAAMRAGLLVALSTLYAEAAHRVDLLRRYLHLGGKAQVWSNPTSVWTFAAALVLPAGFAALVVVVIYTHIFLRSRRHRLGRSYQIVFGCTTTLLGTMVAIGVQDLTGVGLSHGGLPALVVVLLALAGYTVVSLVATVTAVYLVRRPPGWRAILPGADAVAFEVAMLILGVVTAGFLLNNPWFAPTVFVLMAILHRSTLVRELEVAASTDTKTGLLNAAAWQQLAESHLLRAEREGSAAAVLMIDLDHFKQVNDTFGHQAGDVALRAVADCLKAELRGYDALGRFGGEEFVAVLDRAAPDAAFFIAQRLTHAIRTLTPMPTQLDSPLSITASIGVANYPADGTSIDALIRAADNSLHTAKAAGRDRVHHTAR